MDALTTHPLSMMPPGAATSATAQALKLRQASEQLVSTAFIMPLLDSARSTALKGSYGHGGRGEEIFAEHMNVLLSERIAASSRLGVADALYEKLAQRYLDEVMPSQPGAQP